MPVSRCSSAASVSPIVASVSRNSVTTWARTLTTALGGSRRPAAAACGPPASHSIASFSSGPSSVDSARESVSTLSLTAGSGAAVTRIWAPAP